METHVFSVCSRHSWCCRHVVCKVRGSICHYGLYLLGQKDSHWCLQAWREQTGSHLTLHNWKQSASKERSLPLTPAEEKGAQTSICAHYCSALYKYTDGSVSGTASKRLLPKSEKEKLINKCINVGMYKGLQGLAAPSLLLFSPPTPYPHTFQVQQLSAATPSPVATIERVREATSK